MRDGVEPDVSVVVLAYRQVDRLDAVLEQLDQHDSRASFEVLVVANDVPTLVSAVIDRHEWVHRIDSPINRGFGGGCNLGARQANGRYLLFLNDDATIVDGWLDGLVAVLDRHPEVAAVASALVNTDGVVLEAGGAANVVGDVWPPDRGRPLRSLQGRGPRRVSYATGGSLLVRAEVFNDIGGFDMAYHPAYFEDADLSCRIWAAGHEVWAVTTSVVIHAESASTPSAARRALQVRNGVIFRGHFVERFRRCGLPVLEPGHELEAASITRVLFVDDRVPAPGVGSGAARARQNLLALAGTGAQVVFHPREPAEALDPELQAAGIELAHDLAAVPEGSVRVVVVSRPHNYELWELLKAAHPDARFVYDAEARFSARMEKQLALGELEDTVPLERELAEMLELEKAVVRAADAVVTISTDEQPWFETNGAAEVHWVDPLPDRIEPGTATPRDRKQVIFVAGWEAGPDSPNGDALRWLAGSVLPELERLGVDVVVEVTGGGVPESIRALESDRLRFLGRVDDLDELHRGAQLAVAPTRYGAGVKLKVLDALVCATPVVATTVGAEGIAGHWRDTITVADDGPAFASAIAELVTDAELWQRRHQQLLTLAGQHRANAAAAWASVLGTSPGSMQN